MAQRVGIARALAVQPEILLLDEPLGALDAMTKITMQEELARIWREENVTMILVTHDLEEAIYLADRVLILPKEQDGRRREIEIDLPRPRTGAKPASSSSARTFSRNLACIRAVAPAVSSRCRRRNLPCAFVNVG